MNRCNDWQTSLKYANEDLEPTGFSILMVEPEEGSFDCQVWKDDEFLETYAGNYYEDELCALIEDAVAYIKRELIK
jgi:hypothetical protein